VPGGRAATAARLATVLFVVLLLALSLPSPSRRAPRASPAGAFRQTLRIGVLAPVTGPYAGGGVSFLQAVHLAAEEANARGGVLGRRVELVEADTQGKVETARAETLRLVSREKVAALVGAYLSEETVGVIEAAAASRTPVIVPVAATEEITDRVRREPRRFRHVFRVSYSISQWAAMMGEFMKTQGVRRYAFVGAAIRWNRELAAALRANLARAGAEPAYEGFYSPGNPTFEPVAVAAAAARPDLVVLGDPGKNAVAFVKRLREIAPRLPVLSVGGTLGDARVAAALPLDGPLYVQAAAWRGSSAAATRYVEAFERRFGFAPVGYSDTLPHDALTVLLEAVRQAGRTDAEAIIAALERGAFPAAAGTYRFDEAHQARWGLSASELHGVVVAWERGGRARIVFPRPQAAP